jgi:hypothetical protein
VEGGFPPVTQFRPFAVRQTGIYRRAARLSDAEAGAVTRACCDARFCLKRRWWTVKGLAADEPSAKSIIPCLEPCALLLDLARLAADDGDEAFMLLSASELGELAQVIEAQNSFVAAADLEHTANPRRARWLIERNALALAKPSGPA